MVSPFLERLQEVPPRPQSSGLPISKRGRIGKMGGKRGEMTQILHTHMNKIKNKIQF
jgi:hypothetical protein